MDESTNQWNSSIKFKLAVHYFSSNLTAQRLVPIKWSHILAVLQRCSKNILKKVLKKGVTKIPPQGCFWKVIQSRNTHTSQIISLESFIIETSKCLPLVTREIPIDKLFKCIYLNRFKKYNPSKAEVINKKK